MEKCPPLHFRVVTIEKGAFKSPSPKVVNLLLYCFSYSYVTADIYEQSYFNVAKERTGKT